MGRRVLSAMLALIFSAGVAYAETLEEYLIRQADPRTFDPEGVHPDATYLQRDGDAIIVLTGAELRTIQLQGRAITEHFEVIEFEILGLVEADQYVTVVMRVVCDVIVGGVRFLFSLTAHEVYERHGESYRLLTGVQYVNP